MDEWLKFLNMVGATFWRGFPYDIVFFFVLVLSARYVPDYWKKWFLFIALFMAVMIAVNLAVGTIPAWLNGETW